MSILEVQREKMEERRWKREEKGRLFEGRKSWG